MTKEDVKKILYRYTLLDETYPKEDIEAFEIAIKALERDSFEDHNSISKESLFYWLNDLESRYTTILEKICHLQSELQSLIKEVNEE